MFGFMKSMKVIFTEVFLPPTRYYYFSQKRLGESEDSGARDDLPSFFFSEIGLNTD